MKPALEQSYANPVNATVVGWPSGGNVCLTPMLFPKVLNAKQGNSMYHFFQVLSMTRPDIEHRPIAYRGHSINGLLTKYKKILPSLEYCSHVWGGAPKSTLCLLNKVQSKAICLNNDPGLTKSLQPFSHRRLVVDLSIFYRCFHGHYSQEIRDISPVPLGRVRTTRSSAHSHPFQVSLPTSQTLSHKSSFIPRTCNLWNALPSSCFPESYNLPSFKSKINKLDLIALSSWPFTCSFFPCYGLSST